MMKTNLDIIKDGLTEQTVDIFIENSEWDAHAISKCSLSFIYVFVTMFTFDLVSLGLTL